MVSGEAAYIFAVKGTFIQSLHCLDVLHADGAEGLLPWSTEVVVSTACQECDMSQISELPQKIKHILHDNITRDQTWATRTSCSFIVPNKINI